MKTKGNWSYNNKNRDEPKCWQDCCIELDLDIETLCQLEKEFESIGLSRKEYRIHNDSGKFYLEFSYDNPVWPRRFYQ